MTTPRKVRRAIVSLHKFADKLCVLLNVVPPLEVRFSSMSVPDMLKQVDNLLREIQGDLLPAILDKGDIKVFRALSEEWNNVLENVRILLG
jgi:hypothetical protein